MMQIAELRFPQWLTDVSTQALKKEDDLWSSWVRDPNKDVCDVKSVRCLNEHHLQHILFKAIVRGLVTDSRLDLKVCFEWPREQLPWQAKHEQVDLAFFEKGVYEWKHEPKFLVEIKHGKLDGTLVKKCAEDVRKLLEFKSQMHSSRFFCLAIAFDQEGKSPEKIYRGISSTSALCVQPRDFILGSKDREKLHIGLFEVGAQKKAQAAAAAGRSR